MSLRIRKGTEQQRLGIVFDMGEIIWTTDGEKLYVGDGVSYGGKNIAAQLAGVGIAFNPATGKLDSSATFNTDAVTEGNNNLYFTNQRAQAGVWAALQEGQSLGNVQFVYDELTEKLYANATPDGVGITAIQQDTNPHLGGNLNLNTHNVTGAGDIGITGNISASGTLTVTTGLGDDLSLNGFNINGSGNVNITGSIVLNNSKLTIDGPHFISTERSTPTNTSNGADNDNLLYAGSSTFPATLWVSSVKNFGVMTGLVGGDANDGTALYYRTSRGTLAAPSILTPGDRIAKNVAQGWDGEKYWHAGGYGIGTDPAETITVDMVPGRFEAQTRGPAGVNSLFYTSRGVLTGAVLQPTTFADPTARDAALIPGVLEAGMICFVTDSTGSGGPAKFQGYNGTAWVDLG